MFKVIVICLALGFIIGCTTEKKADCKGAPVAVVKVYDNNGDLVK